MKKLNAEMCKKLSDKGLIKKDTYDKVLKFANGGIVPTALDPNAGSEIVPDVATMQAPTAKIESAPVAKSMADQLEYKNLEGVTEKDAALAAEELRKPAASKAQPMQVEGYIPEPQASPQMQKQGMLGDYGQAFNTMESAIQQDAALGKQEAQKSMEYADQMANQMQQIQQKQEILAASQRVELDNQFQKLNQAMNETANIKMDPSRVWADKSTGQKLGMAVALFFSGINGSQAGMQMLENSINRDLEAQRIDLATKKDALVAKRSLLGDMMQRFGNEQQALVAAKASALNIAEVKLKAQLAQLQGTKAGIEGQKALAEIQLKKAELGQKFRDTALLNPAYVGADARMQKVLKIPDQAVRAEAMKEIGLLDQIQNGQKEVESIFSDTAGPMGKIPFTAASAKQDVIAAKLFSAVKAVVGEKMSDRDSGMIEAFVPKPLDTPAQKLEKKNGLINWMQFRTGERTPVLTGLGIAPKMFNKFTPNK